MKHDELDEHIATRLGALVHGGDSVGGQLRTIQPAKAPQRAGRGALWAAAAALVVAVPVGIATLWDSPNETTLGTGGTSNQVSTTAASRPVAASLRFDELGPDWVVGEPSRVEQEDIYTLTYSPTLVSSPEAETPSALVRICVGEPSDQSVCQGDWTSEITLNLSDSSVQVARIRIDGSEELRNGALAALSQYEVPIR